MLTMRQFRFLIVLLFLSAASAVRAQVRNGGQLSNISNGNFTYDSQGRIMRKNTGNDSLKRRDSNADSITIFYRYFDSTRVRLIDSSINDFTTRFPLPYYYNSLGNYGTAAHSLLFNPRLQPGFDAGFHAFDIYGFKVEDTKFYQTTRPYTEMAYVLGSKAEQLVNVTHTQNRKSNLNFSLEYRFSNAPGNIKNQNASHNNFRFTTHYQTNNKKYESFFIFISNKASSSENGGLQDISKLDSLALNDPYELETRLGRAGAVIRNPFNTAVSTGNLYKSTTLLYRHHIDFGPRDSIVTDSVTYKIFYPRFRIEHTFRYTGSSYSFFDNNVDSAGYRKYFNVTIPNNVTVLFKDGWTDLKNEFSLISFPEKNNLAQFLKAGIVVQNLQAKFYDSIQGPRYHNISLIGEYRNRTRNQVWDIEANGEFYLNGFNSGDYGVRINMKRKLGTKNGYLQLGFQNVNRSPSFLLNTASSFPVLNRTAGFGKENIIRFYGQYENPRHGWKLGGEYFAVNNYMYFDSFFTARQEATLFNVLHLQAEKKFRLSRFWNWYTEIHIQQTTGQPPVNLPLLLTRNRIAFEGNFATNLFLSTGLELRYASPYKGDDYSPFLGQYFYQNTHTISNRPDINAFLHFRIKSFKGFFRVENLNTLNIAKGFSFNKPNFMTQYNPGTGLWMRFGLWWTFVN
jgi:hypothetical protein